MGSFSFGKAIFAENAGISLPRFRLTRPFRSGDNLLRIGKESDASAAVFPLPLFH